jgi:hypothetical protein
LGGCDNLWPAVEVVRLNNELKKTIKVSCGVQDRTKE